MNLDPAAHTAGKYNETESEMRWWWVVHDRQRNQSVAQSTRSSAYRVKDLVLDFKGSAEHVFNILAVIGQQCFQSACKSGISILKVCQCWLTIQQLLIDNLYISKHCCAGECVGYVFPSGSVQVAQDCWMADTFSADKFEGEFRVVLWMSKAASYQGEVDIKNHRIENPLHIASMFNRACSSNALPNVSNS